MWFFSEGNLSSLIGSYGYLAVAVIVALESMGLPLPGETTLVLASIVAARSGALNIWIVVGAAALGAIVGDNIGFWIGREFGYRALRRYGPRLGITERRMKLGQYLFMRHGGKVVFFGRFVAILRALAALLAGTNRMPWVRFLMFNAAGGIVWAAAYGLGAYVLGTQLTRVAGPIGLVLAGIAVLGLLAGGLLLRRFEERLTLAAEEAIPGPIEGR